MSATRCRHGPRVGFAGVLGGVLALVVGVGVVPAGPVGTQVARAVPAAMVEGPVPGTVPGDPLAPAVEDTYPFFSTYLDLAARGYVEQEFILSGAADTYSATGALVGEDVPYRTRIVVRRPEQNRQFNGTVLVEWQNVTAGYDLDALWSPDQIMDRGYAWVGVSAQRVGVDQLAGWSPARYGTLDVTGGRTFMADEMSYDVFSQAAQALQRAAGRRSAGWAQGRQPAGHRGVTVGGADEHLLQLRAPADRPGVRRLCLRGGGCAHTGGPRAGVPDPVRDRRAHAHPA